MIPRMGGGAEHVNCFVLKIDQGDDAPLVIKGLEGDDLKCLALQGGDYMLQRTVSLRDIRASQLRIKHFYGHADVEFGGLFEYLAGRLTAWPYVQIHAVRTFDVIARFLFNKRKLITKQRTELLGHMLKKHLEGQTQFDSLQLLTDLYSLRWVEHPDRDIAQHQMEYFLDAMAETGELRKVNLDYVVTGKALQAIELYEEQERRHVESVKTQRRMVWLTVVLALLAGVQAGLIKFDPLLDWSTKPASQTEPPSSPQR